MNTIEAKSTRFSITHEDGVWYVEMQLTTLDSEEPIIIRGTIYPHDDLLALAEYIISEKRKTQQ